MARLNTYPASLDDFFAPFLPSIDVMTTCSYPPYNLLKTGDLYTLEFAVAGFTRNDLKVKKRGNILTVSGTKATTEADMDGASEYLHRGIANRNFTVQFRLTDDLEVVSSDYDEGLLSVDMEVNRGPDVGEQVIPIY